MCCCELHPGVEIRLPRLLGVAERVRHGRQIPVPAELTVVVTALLGWIDEGIQSLLPNRAYDLRDVGFNALAGLMAIVASLLLALARRMDFRRRSKSRRSG